MAFLKAQWAFSEKHAAAHLDEVCGLAKGYDVSPRDLFAYLHLGAMEDGDPEKDGCSVAVISDTKNGPLLAKNRDFGAEHQKLQRVVRHQDPLDKDLWCMFITSLGSPGAYSSGINSHGLAVADTAVGCSKLGVGWLRYFLMTEILWKAASVDEALDLISSVPHVGGGALVLVDKSGKIASVELGNEAIHIERADTGVLTHTNHYFSESLIPFQCKESEEAYFASSVGRLGAMNHFFAQNQSPLAVADVADLMSSHGSRWQSLCCHGDIGDGYTISSAIFSPANAGLQFCAEKPCSGNWAVYNAPDLKAVDAL
ncbi:MAG: hypothetical protein COB08_009145 [Rhodobacteraceae bacterium]|nr:hypothetical protein [Paracoccaceae bacterium]